MVDFALTDAEMDQIAALNQHDAGTVNFSDANFVKCLIETYGRRPLARLHRLLPLRRLQALMVGTTAKNSRSFMGAVSTSFSPLRPSRRFCRRRGCGRLRSMEATQQQRVRLVIFDFDGTIADTRLNIVLTMRETMRELGLPEADEAACAATIGLRLKDGFGRLLPGVPGETLDICVSTYRRLFDERKRTMAPKPFPGAVELLASFRERSILLAIASSRSSFTLAPMLRDMGLDGAFDVVVCGDDVANPKPAPDAVLSILRRLNVPPTAALVVGDMPVDIEMGRAAGVRTCGVLWGNAKREQLAASGADSIAVAMDEILATA